MRQTTKARFEKPERATEAAPAKVWSDFELKEMDREVREKFNGLGTRTDLMRWFQAQKAGRIVRHSGAEYLEVIPSAMASLDDKLWQWSRWRSRHFPFDRIAAYDEIARQEREMVVDQKFDVASTIVEDMTIAFAEQHFTLAHKPVPGTVEVNGMPVAAAKAVASDQAAKDLYPTEEVDPNDIPF